MHLGHSVLKSTFNQRFVWETLGIVGISFFQGERGILILRYITCCKAIRIWSAEGNLLHNDVIQNAVQNS